MRNAAFGTLRAMRSARKDTEARHRGQARDPGAAILPCQNALRAWVNALPSRLRQAVRAPRSPRRPRPPEHARRPIGRLRRKRFAGKTLQSTPLGPKALYRKVSEMNKMPKSAVALAGTRQRGYAEAGVLTMDASTTGRKLDRFLTDLSALVEALPSPAAKARMDAGLASLIEFLESFRSRLN